MNVGAKLAAFTAVTAAAFGLAFGVGTVLDPLAPEDDLGLASHGGTEGPAGHAAVSADALPGLAVSSRGYTLRVLDVTPARGETAQVGFTIAGPDGRTVLDFDTAHEKQMHLIVVRRDMAHFQHLHPRRTAAGVWRTPVDLREAGVYRVFADFSPAALGETITLGADVFVPGQYTPAELPAPSSEWSAAGYEVTLAGAPVAGQEADLAFTVRRAGVEVTDLKPYLGAFGHLVSLRSGDLAYLHTHPSAEASGGERGGPQIRFGTTFPTPGRYRLYLNFAHGGEVRTVEFTVDVPGEPDPAATVDPSPSGPDVHSGH